MNSICLSAAPNLRCNGLTRTENIVLLVPPAIELIFSFTLVLSRASDSRRTHWFLFLDGVFFLLLAVLDFLSHIIPQATSTLAIFKIIDFVLAAASSIPILVYMLFLFLYARSNLVSSLPKRFRHVAGFSLFAIIPFTIAFSELGSLLGLTHREVLVEQKPIFAVGFSNATMQRLALTFSAGTVALLTVFQAAIFTMAFIRLVRAFLDERRVDTSNGRPNGPDEIHLFRGLGWLTAGLKLGAIETVIGFVNVSFETAMTRRVLRLFARGALIIGVMKGMNLVEDFVRFESDMRAGRSKRISRLFISNPRNSTFREMSPQASSFHAAQQEKRAGRLGPSPLALGANSTHSAFQASGARRKERVTVVYDGKTPPVLQLRFSVLDVPLPPLPAAFALPTITEGTEGTETPRGTLNTFASGRPTPKDFWYRPTADSFDKSHHASNSSRTDSIEAMRDAAATNISGMASSGVPGNSSLARGANTAGIPPSSDISPGNSIKRKPVPQPTVPRRPQARPPSLYLDRARQYGLDPEYATVVATSPSSPSTSDGASSYSNHTMHTTPNLTRVSTLDTAPESPGSFVSPKEPRLRSHGAEDKAVQRRQADAGVASGGKRHARLVRLRRELRASGAVGEDDDEDDAPVEQSWAHKDQLFDLQPPPRAYGAPSDVDDDETSEAVLDEAWRRAGLKRVRAMSHVQVHTTPVAEQSEATRMSLFAVEEELGWPESYDESNIILGQSPVRLTRLDSGVLGEEDRRLVRQRIYV